MLPTLGRLPIVVGALLGAVLACGDGGTSPHSDAAGGGDVLGALDGVSSGGQFAQPVALPSAAPSTAGCSYADGRYTCPPVTRDGVTLTRVFSFHDAAGAPQRQYDALATASVLNQLTVRGRIVRAGTTAEVDHRLSQQASGLAGQETRRIVDGTGAGTTTVTVAGPGTTRTFTVAHADTTRAIVLPVRPSGQATPGAPLYPLGGSVTSVIRTDGGAVPGLPTAALEMRATVRYDGTSVARVELATQGVTQACTLDLAVRPPRLACPAGPGLPLP